MDRFVDRAALPLLGFALALLALRLISWPLWEGMDSFIRMAYALVVLSGLFFAVMFASHSPHGYPRRNLVIWGGIAAGFIAVALFNNEYRAWEISRTWAPAPQSSAAEPVGVAEDVITLNRRFDGHYYIDAWAGASQVEFLVDTGATGVALAVEDARRMGVRLSELEYNIPMSTADGLAYGAAVTIPELVIRGHRFTYVDAVVMRNGTRSLLGMSILEEFSSIEMSADRLILRR